MAKKQVRGPAESGGGTRTKAGKINMSETAVRGLGIYTAFLSKVGSAGESVSSDGC